MGIKVILDAKRKEFFGSLEAIAVQMEEREGLSVDVTSEFVREREGWRGQISFIDTKRAGDAFDEMGLSGTKIPAKQDDTSASKMGARKLLAEIDRRLR